MNQQDNGAASLRRVNQPPSFVRMALAGLTPQVIAIVAALLLVRVVGSTINDVVVAAKAHKLDDWLWALGRIYWALAVMAVPIIVGVIATGNLGPQSGPKRVIALAAAVIVSTCVGVFLRVALQDWVHGRNNLAKFRDYLPELLFRYVMLAGMLTAVSEFYRHETSSVAAMRRAEVDKIAFEREMAEARLQVMQAQIEPHFLFNTLANVRRLYQTDNAAGRTMLEDLMRYLEIALPRMRDNESTLERDATLVDAYLRIQQVRMGRRLAYDIDIPAALRSQVVPPMMLLTLVENAIKHGLNPLPEGGMIRIGARREADTLIVTVVDTGAGFQQGSGAGAGLANIRARLSAQFGERGSLSLSMNQPHGVTATLKLPIADALGVP